MVCGWLMVIFLSRDHNFIVPHFDHQIWFAWKLINEMHTANQFSFSIENQSILELNWILSVCFYLILSKFKSHIFRFALCDFVVIYKTACNAIIIIMLSLGVHRSLSQYSNDLNRVHRKKSKIHTQTEIRLLSQQAAVGFKSQQ